MKKRQIKVSVPYRGSLYSNRRRKTYEKENYMFPSPIGVLYILISYKDETTTLGASEVSVPYRGSLYSKFSLP